MDTVGNFLTIIRNASRARKEFCVARLSNMNRGIAQILKNEGYISGFDANYDDNGHTAIKILLKYVDGQPAITEINRHSRPGCRLYYSYSEIPRVLNGYGISVLTTSRGILQGKDARRQKVGGELLCKIW